MKILLQILFSVFLFAEALTPDEAFKFLIDNNKQFLNIKINLSDDVYLYKDELKITKNEENITTTFNLDGAVIKDDKEVFFNELNFDFPIYAFKNKDNIKIYYQGCSLEGLCYQPLVASFVYENDRLNLKYANKELQKLKKEKLQKEQVGSDYEITLLNSTFIFSLFTFFIYGLLLSLTPCTLPMVPIISSILIKSSGKSPIISSIIYVLGMAISYTIAGVVAALLGSGVQAFFQNQFVIFAFSGIFILLALSMFGFYELKMPNLITNHINSKMSKLNGLIGIFLMGVLSALIVGPCVAAPLAGLLIYIANSNDIILGASALFCMSIGMGIPLIAIGFGFKFITGAWMQNINKFFGFALLCIAIYFLSRVLNEQIINTSYAILGFIFVVYFNLFESAKNKFHLAFKVVLVGVLAFSIILLNKTYNHQEIILENKAKLEFVKEDNNLELKGKNIIYFTAKWCENCKIMDKTTFKDDLVINALNKYNLIKIDLTNPNEFEQAMAEKYKVFGPPVLVIVDGDGKVLKQIVGLVDSNTLLKELDF